MVRNINTDDLKELRLIHSKFFANEFSFEDFCQTCFHSFVITDEKDGKIVLAGAIRPLAEVVAITNYEKSPRLRAVALHETLQIAEYVLRNTNFTQLHAFVQDEKWMNQLIRSGFKKCVGTPVYFNLR